MNTPRQVVCIVIRRIVQALTLLFLIASLIFVAAVYAEDIACFTYDGTLNVSVVGDSGSVRWEDSVDIQVDSAWSAVSEEPPMIVLFEGFRDGNLEITAWVEEERDVQIATGELIPGEEACVKYPENNSGGGEDLQP